MSYDRNFSRRLGAGDFGGILIMAAIVIGVVAVVGLIGVLVADNIGAPEISGTATVTQKQYHAPYVSFVPMHVGKSTIMVPQSHPARYQVCVQVDDTAKDSGCGDVSQAYYDSLEAGNRVAVTYVLGNVTHAFYLRQISS